MAVPKTPKTPQKKLSVLTIIIYASIVILIFLACWFLGTAMDFAVKSDGKIDINLIENGFDKVVNNPSLLMSAIDLFENFKSGVIYYTKHRLKKNE